MDESGEHHSQQTDTRTENEIHPHILTHMWVRKNENTWTQGRGYYKLGSIGWNRGGTAGGSWGGIAWGETPNVGEGEKASKTLPCVYLRNCLACSAHVPQNLKCKKKKEKKVISSTMLTIKQCQL